MHLHTKGSCSHMLTLAPVTHVLPQHCLQGQRIRSSCMFTSTLHLHILSLGFCTDVVPWLEVSWLAEHSGVIGLMLDPSTATEAYLRRDWSRYYRWHSDTLLSAAAVQTVIDSQNWLTCYWRCNRKNCLGLSICSDIQYITRNNVLSIQTYNPWHKNVVPYLTYLDWNSLHLSKHSLCIQQYEHVSLLKGWFIHYRTLHVRAFFQKSPEVNETLWGLGKVHGLG